MTIVTRRLRLIPLDASLAHAQLEDRAIFFKRLGALPRPDWPPPLYDETAIRWVIERLERGEDPAWHVRVITSRSRLPGRSRALGVAGFKGPPDHLGDVEIGYSIVAGEQRRGVCAEAVAALIEFAWSDPRVACVSAHTLEGDETAASRRVLERRNFFGPIPTDEAGVVRYERRRDADSNRSAWRSAGDSHGDSAGDSGG